MTPSPSFTAADLVSAYRAAGITFTERAVASDVTFANEIARKDGVLAAERAIDFWVQDLVREMEADGLAARQYEYDAYGLPGDR